MRGNPNQTRLSLHALTPRDPAGMLAGLIYLAASFSIFGRQLAGHFHDLHIGGGGDCYVFMWYLVWWPYALIHRLNPFVTYFIWAPVGINLTWATCIPLASLLAWPITAAAGPVASFNVIMLLAPALAGWSAFLLCRHLSKSWWPSLLGGYVFGFSAYLGHEELSGNPHTTLVFLVPLAALAVVRSIEDELAPRRLIAALAAILAAQFLTSTEIFATMTMFGAIALALGWIFAPAQTRRRLVKAAIAIACAYAITAVIISPYLYWLFAFGAPHGELWPFLNEHFNFGNLIFFIPSGRVLLIIAVIYAWRERRSPAGRTLIGLLIAVSVLMGAPHLRFHDATFPTPAGLLMELPIINKALPFRFSMYSFLILAIVVSLWFGPNAWGAGVNAALAAAVILASIPELSYQWAYPAESPPFFANDIYRNYVKPGGNLLILPFGYHGNSMVWQAKTGLYFRMVDGWVGAHPAEFDGWPIFAAFNVAAFLPDARDQLGAFMAHHAVEVAVVADNDPAAKSWDALFANFSSAENRVGGVAAYRISPDLLAPYRDATAPEMRQRAAAAAIDSLLAAAAQWIAAGNDASGLTPYAALQKGMLKSGWFVGSTADVLTGKTISAQPGTKGYLYTGAWIGGTPDGRVKAVLHGSYRDLAGVISRYRRFAAHIYLPYPHDLLSPGATMPPADRRLYLEMDFARNQIAAIASQLHPQPPR